MQICSVCSEHVPKYKCPACKIRYCSVSCYKNHKDGCLPVKQTASPALAPDFKATHSGGDWSVEDLLDEDEQSDRVPLQKLKELGESKDLEALLCNPHLRQLLLTVDQAEDKAAIMKVAMQEPLFVEFADQCLKIVEPTTEENTPMD
ncbi:zinc finger HIT domain-containing protein 3 [Anguilla rostrata]|uniref:Zinc finger HIT domain-containing protein 3 n=1 Tax=Anguilla anguilla TaxID=7936 RepID=A0A0E9WHR7_ANGAN|nr:zinc finger HIT domain-containing protein 3 [Anguilla anguilla]KAG5844386.1 hypothetical protein ANANG_G00161980 [Anguilla anguilla]